QIHREAAESDNSAAEAADTGIAAADVTFRVARETSHHRKLKAQRDLPEQTEQPKSAKLQQKKAIKKEYADARRSSGEPAKASEIASRAAKSASEKVRRTVEYVRKNSHVILIVLAIGALLMMFMSIISSCAMMFGGALGNIGSTTYQSSPEDMTEAEAAYCDLENVLQEKLDDYAAQHPGCDEYRITGTVLGHDPYVLTSILSAIYGEYTLSAVQSNLNVIFDMQYELTETVTAETRYRTETRTAYYQYRDPNTGDVHLIPYTYDVQVPYSHSICTVTLTCTPMEELAENLLTEEQMELYETYLETQGNYPDLFSE
ncbi:MAG: NlpC/P60 family protein, partial [Clostridia bacterium]|nr:NlpC/P60 family protein [Clostridia bacterium]